MAIVVLYGEESYLLEQAVIALRDEVVDPAMASLTHRVYTQPNLPTVLEAVGSMSLALGGKTLIEIRQFDSLREAAKDPATERQLEELKVLLTDTDDSKVILFVSTKIDGKIKFPKWLLKQPGVRVEKFEPLKFWEGDKAVDFILNRYSREKGIVIARDAVELLVSAFGLDLAVLASEVDKLALYAHDRAITLADAQKVCLNSNNMFGVIERWIVGEDPESNFRDLREVLLKHHPVETFGLMQTMFNTAFRVCWLRQQGLTVDTIAQQIGQKPFTVKKSLERYGHVSMPRLLKLKHRLTELEWHAKTGQMEASLALDVLLGA